jgi:hypothetical protein
MDGLDTQSVSEQYVIGIYPLPILFLQQVGEVTSYA